MSVCWLNGALVDKSRAKVSLFDHGLLYGDGVFEGIRFYNKRAFRLDAHLQRLKNSTAAIFLKIPYSLEQLEDAVYEVIKAYGKPDGYLRLVVTRGEGELGIDPGSCIRGTVFIIADHISLVKPHVLEAGARLITASTRCLPADVLDPRVKSLNYLNHILAKIEAGQAGADEAVMLNAQGKVTEGTTDNLFIVKNNSLYTPPVTDGALEGITRECVMELAQELAIECHEKRLAVYDLYTADELILTGTAMELVPVKEIDGRKLASCPGPLFKRLQRAFREMLLKVEKGDSLRA